MNNKPSQTVAPYLSIGGPLTGSSTIGTSPQAVIDASVPTDIGAYVKAAPTNTGVIFILGNGSDTTGFPLGKTDQALWCPVSNINLIRARAATSGDTIHYIAF